MIDLKDFQTRRNVLETWHDRALDAGELLQVDDAALREAKENLHAQRFIVAVCGQMNSGKSTLLNALLFGDEVLPSASTTTTAKITLMEGSTDESVEATLYTREEFQQVLDESKKDHQAAAELSKARDSARTAGIREARLFTEPGRVEQRAGLNDLIQFAAVSEKGGTYNVYVKSVRVRADRPWLHQVTVADTPGTNDPNPVRDRVTRDWVQRADAVMYVTFAGQAGMDSEDVKFIDEHLAHVSPAHRIVAVNKCDDEPDAEAIRRHIRKIQHSGDLRMKNLFGNDDQIVLTSGLGGLIAAMQDAERALSEDMRWHADKMCATGYLDAERHGVDKLRGLIERRIIANRGEGVIRAHQSRIANLFERADTRLAQEEADLRYNLEAVATSAEERAEEKRRLSQDILAVGEHFKRTRNDVSNDVDRLHITLDENLEVVREKVMQSVEESLQNAKVRGLAEQASWGIRDALYKERSTIAKQVRSIVEGVETKLNEAEGALSDEIMRSGIGRRITQTHLLPMSARSICKEAEEELIADLDQSGLPEVVDRATNWWQRTFNTRRGRNEGTTSLRGVLGEALKQALEVIPGQTERELKKLADEAVGSMEKSCRDSLEKRKGQLEALERQEASDEETRERIDRDLDDVEEKKRKVKSLRDEYEAAVAS